MLHFFSRYFFIAFAFIASFILVPTSLFTLYIPPTIPSQGVAHRIFYWHVPIAWVALYAPCIASFNSVLYLITRKDIYDCWSLASVRVSYLFALAVLFSGPLWASTEWGTYWNWKDSRLISFFILVLILSSYFLIRNQGREMAHYKIMSSLIAILAAFASIMTWFAIRWMEPDTHPSSVLGKMSPLISQGFWISVLAYHLLFWMILLITIRHEKMKRGWEHIRTSRVDYN